MLGFQGVFVVPLECAVLLKPFHFARRSKQTKFRHIVMALDEHLGGFFDTGDILNVAHNVKPAKVFRIPQIASLRRGLHQA